MRHDELIALLTRARTVLGRYLFDGQEIRDDIAEVCMAIDAVTEASPAAGISPTVTTLQRAAIAEENRRPRAAATSVNRLLVRQAG